MRVARLVGCAPHDDERTCGACVTCTPDPQLRGVGEPAHVVVVAPQVSRGRQNQALTGDARDHVHRHLIVELGVDRGNTLDRVMKHGDPAERACRPDRHDGIPARFHTCFLGSVVHLLELRHFLWILPID